jgi:uncharacterized membrane protein
MYNVTLMQGAVYCRRFIRDIIMIIIVIVLIYAVYIHLYTRKNYASWEYSVAAIL